MHAYAFLLFLFDLLEFFTDPPFLQKRTRSALTTFLQE